MHGDGGGERATEARATLPASPLLSAGTQMLAGVITASVLIIVKRKFG